jgi:signal peptidase
MLSAMLQNPRQAAAQVLNFALILSSAFMVRFPQHHTQTPHLAVLTTNLPPQMWKGLSIATDSPSPIVVVLSGSMEPAFQRGDLLLLWNRNVLAETQVGEVVVYNVRDKDIPIVHRVVRKFGSGCVMSHGGDAGLAEAEWPAR